ncbi:MAG: hypothetical protein HXX11_00705 [Desulfuromonadales bacterium]|nr:hypothetical protein [Desulfuromonadales bacterium]
MSNQRGNFISMDNHIGQLNDTAMPRVNRMTPYMLLVMVSMSMVGIYIGYQISHNVLVSFLFGGVFGRIGMWVGMISYSLVAGVEDFLQNIFS